MARPLAGWALLFAVTAGDSMEPCAPCRTRGSGRSFTGGVGASINSDNAQTSERAARIAAESELADARAEAANAQADLTSSEALIAHLKLAIEKLRRELYGTRSERKARLLDQMEPELEELEAVASEDELAAQQVAGGQGREAAV